MHPHLATAMGAALLAAGLAATPACAQGGEQGATNAITPPSTQHQPTVLTPKPDIHGRSGGGVGEQHGSDTASPGGNTGTTGGAAGTGMTGGANPDAGSGNTVLPPKKGGTSQ
jgi:hypothetical protein